MNGSLVIKSGFRATIFPEKLVNNERIHKYNVYNTMLLSKEMKISIIYVYLYLILHIDV